MSDAGPVPLHLPAILQNPVNPYTRQVEAHNAQQRERAAARRERDGRTDAGGPRVRGIGKKVVRRRENAAFTSNPHIVPPSRNDYTPSVPFHPRPLRSTFPPTALSRSTPIPPVEIPVRDPSSASSVSGTFSTSLKGTRALLRKRGRRAEMLVALVEEQIRAWLGGKGWLVGDDGEWTVVDPTLATLDEPPATTTGSGSGSALNPRSDNAATDPALPEICSSRRMPALHQIQTTLPPLPRGPRASLLELSRSPAHLTWAVADSFDRLVVHLVARYYELVSWSEDHITADAQNVRLTHMVLPSLSRPNVVPSHALLTPETSDVSGQSSAETPVHTDIDDSGKHDSDPSSETDTETETETEFENGFVVGYSLEPGMRAIRGASSTSPPSLTTPLASELVYRLDGLHLAPLERAISNSSSMYASESDPEGSDYGGLGDSLTLPQPGLEGESGWTSVVYAEQRLPRPPRAVHSDAQRFDGVSKLPDKPSFFEYLYGA